MRTWTNTDSRKNRFRLNTRHYYGYDSFFTSVNTWIERDEFICRGGQTCVGEGPGGDGWHMEGKTWTLLSKRAAGSYRSERENPDACVGDESEPPWRIINP